MNASRTSRAAVGITAAFAVAAVATAPAHAAPAVEPTFSTLSGKPRHLVLGPDGNVWTPLSDSTKEIAKIAPDGTVTEFDVDTLANAEGIVSDGTNLWVTKTGGVARFSPSNPAGAVATPIAAITDPRAITMGPDGNLWTGSGDKVVHFAPANPAGFTATTVAGMGARGIAAGADGQLHVADFLGQRLVNMTTAGVTTFTALGGGPQEVAPGTGTQLLVANPGAVPQTVARVDAGAVVGTPLAMAGTDPFGLTQGNDGATWVARFAAGDLGRIAPDGTVTALPIGAATGPRNVTKGPGDTLFVGLETAMKVARVTGVSASAPTTTTPPTTTTTPPTTTTPFTISALKVTTKGRSATVGITAGPSGTVRFQVQRRTTGRSVDGTCVAATKANAKRRACARYIASGPAFTKQVTAAGPIQVKVPSSVQLRAGQRYRVQATAGTTKLVSTTFGVR